jgi:hypothetical protein
MWATRRNERGTRANTRAPSCNDQAVPVLRWFLDGALIETDRGTAPAHAGMDLWRSGKHANHGGNSGSTRPTTVCTPY